MDDWKAWTILIVGFLLVIGIVDTAHALYINGIPQVHNGHIIYVSHRYDKWYKYEWTDIEILTYSGDSHHMKFWGHPEFSLNTNYHIHIELRSKFFFNVLPMWVTLNEITELEVIEP